MVVAAARHFYCIRAADTAIFPYSFFRIHFSVFIFQPSCFSIQYSFLYNLSGGPVGWAAAHFEKEREKNNGQVKMAGCLSWVDDSRG